ncbi:hypothetical protein ACOSQ3_023734 [Xanthoceras sorbifolium]
MRWMALLSKYATGMDGSFSVSRAYALDTHIVILIFHSAYLRLERSLISSKQLVLWRFPPQTSARFCRFKQAKEQK